MKLNRTTHDPGELLEFYEEGLTALGALCERTWHDRLEVIAEGKAANLWNPTGSLHEVELHFAPVDATAARDAAREVFPGCPLTFELTEALRHFPVSLERFVLPEAFSTRPPDSIVAEKVWRSQFPDTSRWRLESAWKADYHFSLLMITRCEIQAINQHWSAHRLALSLPSGEPDDALANEVAFHQTFSTTASEIFWPKPDPAKWRLFLQRALEIELSDEMERVRTRQENSLRRELERIDDYFENYERELAARASPSSNKNARIKTGERLAAAQAEHARRRADQVARHEIRVHPKIDALLLIAEKAWRTQVHVDRDRRAQTIAPLFVPRTRRWSETE